jgi:hypothetical protein
LNLEELSQLEYIKLYKLFPSLEQFKKGESL